MKATFLYALGLSLVGTAPSFSAELGAMVQTKYPGVVGASADRVIVDQMSVRLVPVLAIAKPDQTTVPYLVVPDDRYVAELARYKGYAGKPENFIQVRGRPTLVLKASEVQLKMGKPASAFLNYPGIQGKPANYIMIDGVTTVLIKKSEYPAYMRTHVGIADLPANYVMDGGKAVQILPVDDVDFAPLFFHQVSPVVTTSNATLNGQSEEYTNGSKKLPATGAVSDESNSAESQSGRAE